MCNLVSHTATLIFHNGTIIVSLNYEPLKEPHFIVLPKRHVEDVGQLKGEELKAMFDYITKLEKVIKQYAGQEAFIGMNRGRLATQPHIHFHVLPYTVGIRGFFAKAEGSQMRLRHSDEHLMQVKEKVLELLKVA